MTHWKIALPIVCVMLLAAASVLAAIEQPQEAVAKVKQVALFKNGMGYFTREGEFPRKAGPFVIRPLPASSHGTFWFDCGESVKLNALASRKAFVPEPVEATSLLELLQANIGGQVKLYLSSGETLIGKIVALPVSKPSVESDPYVGEQRHTYYGPRVNVPTPQLVIIETEKGVVAFNPNAIQRVDFVDSNAAYHLQKDVEAVEFVGKLDRAPRNRAFTLSYVAKGVAWAPSYRVDISDPETAAISAKALVINEVEDLEDVTLHLITGFPNIQFADVPSPLSLKLTLAQFFQYLSNPPQALLHLMANVAMQQAAPSPGRAGPGYTISATGRATEDLFLYPVENVTLAKGETGYYPVFTGHVPYKHIYQWDIPDYVNADDRYQRPAQTAAEERPQVWHTIRLENETALPWTTAPAMTVARGQVVAQDTLTYTPVNGMTTLKLTRAVEVSAEEQELEVDRVRNAARFYGYEYDRVTVDGKLRIESFKDEAISMEITKTFSGELVSSAPEADVQQLARGLKRMNPTTLLTWHLEVKPDEEKELTYKYTVLVRR